MESHVVVYAVGVDSVPQTQCRPDSRLDVNALRRITDETGARTETVRRDARLDGAMDRRAFCSAGCKPHARRSEV
jgi:hypothetical protein